ncbi:peptidase family m23 domain-containing protein [Ditylenchus destructor]|uniref:Peptidase family m23 domain-containing protein n=1 Tax=Ditylenchus destructor TaxID=166010 RepID=A0AAD4R371_9BILA|nr:peptidase family m23 domain-containing protein [Ditylenchus destructor]
MQLLLLVVSSIFLWRNAEALGCMKTVCSNQPRNFINQLKECPAADGFCGNYKSLRRNNQYVEAVDLDCDDGTAVYAPFDGELTYYQPFGAQPDAQCADQGARIEGFGQWRGYYVLISTVKLIKYGGKVTAGQKIGVAGNLDCVFNGRRSPSNFVRVQVFRQGKPIDPTYHLIDCMCTGQICETNRKNTWIGQSFKYDSRFNGVRGWELKCPISGANEQSVSSEENELRAPRIYSPIDGNIIGRVRIDYSSGTYAGCGNEGLFIVGTGKWEDYEVRLYNVRFWEDLGLGTKRIEQGQYIGQRLLCKDAPDSIFVEMRFQGVQVDVSDAISAENCLHKKFSRIFRF